MLSLDQPEHNGEYLMAVLSALVGGNTVLGVAAEPLLETWREAASGLAEAGLPPGAFRVLPGAAAAPLLAQPALAGAMVHARSRYLHASAREIAAREGAILPLISSVSPRTLLRQTLLEKTVSIDTTAAGGNASLMTMEG